MKYCVQCGAQLQDEARFCSICGTRCDGQSSPQPGTTTAATEGNLFDAFTGTINQLAGGKGAVRPPLRTLFGGTFAKHSKQDAEEIFVCGTEKTTPVLSVEDIDWPRPWLYSRVLLAFVIAFAMLHFCCTYFENLNAFPGVIMVGSFMVPFAALIFFFELNIPKNVTVFTIAKVFLVGGCASLLFTLFLYDVVEVEELDYAGAILVGIVEELGKLAIVAFFIRQEKETKYASNGLLIGAAVGAGFAAFESAGYAFQNLLLYGYEDMMDVILLRAVLAPGGHIVWAAMSGYALMMAKGKQPMTINALGATAFWKIFWIPVVLHAVWDMPIEFGAEYYLIPIVLTVISWVVIMVLISNCLTQIEKMLQEEQAAAQATAQAAAQNAYAPQHETYIPQ